MYIYVYTDRYRTFYIHNIYTAWDKLVVNTGELKINSPPPRHTSNEGWGAGAKLVACFWTFGAGTGAALEKTGAGAGAAPTKNTGARAANILRLLYQLLEDKQHKVIVN